jgi:hypothetical protein
MSVRKLWADAKMEEASSVRTRARGRKGGAISFKFCSEVGNFFFGKECV